MIFVIKISIFITFLQTCTTTHITIEMIRHRLVPLFVRIPPVLQCEVTYRTGYRLVPGEELTRKEIDHEPNVTWPAENDSLYCLCMSGFSLWPIVRYLNNSWKHPIHNGTISNQWQNWLVGNIPGNRLHEGEVLAEYRDPETPPVTGNHWYAFLIYKQPYWINYTRRRQLATEGIRGFFSISWFAKRHQLGNPIAGNFFQWNDPDHTLVPYIQDVWSPVSRDFFEHPDESRPRMKVWTTKGDNRTTFKGKRKNTMYEYPVKTTYPFSYR